MNVPPVLVVIQPFNLITVWFAAEVALSTVAAEVFTINTDAAVVFMVEAVGDHNSAQ
jgi:hypothetical protein